VPKHDKQNNHVNLVLVISISYTVPSPTNFSMSRTLRTFMNARLPSFIDSFNCNFQVPVVVSF
jgi:hypothetical protein